MNTALMEAAKWADELMEAETKSRREKEYVVRDRLAGKIGVTARYLFRLQYQIDEMNDVKGSVYRALMVARKAYDDLCERLEEKAGAMERELRGIEESNAIYQRPAPDCAGVASAQKGAEQEDLK